MRKIIVEFILIEDDDFKKNKVLDFLSEKFHERDIPCAKSVTSALALLKLIQGKHVVLLDMSLPTYDQESQLDTGRPQGFGGIDILRYMEFIGDERKVIIITQFDNFTVNGENISLQDISERLRIEFTDSCIGVVQFDVISDSWKNELLELIKSVKR